MRAGPAAVKPCGGGGRFYSCKPFQLTFLEFFCVPDRSVSEKMRRFSPDFCRFGHDAGEWPPALIK
jgi:hypothetical protein